MTGADKLRVFLRRLGVPEAAFLAVCAQAGHQARRLEELPLPVVNDPLDVYYALGSVAERLEFSVKTVRRRLFAGEFGPPEAVLQDGEQLRVPYSGLHYYLRRHQLDRCAAVLEEQRRVMRAKLGPERERLDQAPTVVARSPGEMRRKVALMGDHG